jgi:hypothetical protein
MAIVSMANSVYMAQKKKARRSKLSFITPHSRRIVGAHAICMVPRSSLATARAICTVPCRPEDA